MSPDAEVAGEIKAMSFQRNVFRACDLVVYVMGTGATITDAFDRSVGSYKKARPWMTLVPRLSPHQPVPFDDDTLQAAWNIILEQFPVLRSIVVGSRGDSPDILWISDYGDRSRSVSFVG